MANGNPKVTPGPAQKINQPPSTMIEWPTGTPTTGGPSLPTQTPGQTSAPDSGQAPNNKTPQP